MSGSAPKQHWSIRAIVIFVAIVGLIANVIAIIIFVTGRNSLPALFSPPPPNTILTPTSTSGIPPSPPVASVSDPFTTSEPWVWIWWVFLTAVLGVLGGIWNARKGTFKTVSQAYVRLVMESVVLVVILFLIDRLIYRMANNWFAAFAGSIGFASFLTIYMIIKVVSRE